MMICMDKENELHIGHDQEHRTDAEVGDVTGRRDVLVDPCEEQSQYNMQHHRAY